MRILIMGLPGSGKTTLAEELIAKLDETGKGVIWLNADKIRELYADWDFSQEGRIRQAKRMRILADSLKEGYAVCDFVAPLKEMRNIFEADFTVWVDTIGAGRYEDTNKMFEIPKKYDVRVTEQDATKWAEIIYQLLVESEDK